MTMPWIVVGICVVFITNIVLNSLVIVVFVAKPVFLTLSNKFVLNLVIGNILTSILIMPCVVASMTTGVWLLGDGLCQTTGFLFSVLVACNNFTLLAISVDRCLAVSSPLLYKVRMTGPRCTTTIMAVWMVAVCESVPPLLGWSSISYNDKLSMCSGIWTSSIMLDKYFTALYVFLSFIVPLSVMTVMYVIIFCAARGNVQRARRNSVIPPSQSEDDSSVRIERREGGSIHTLRRISEGTIRLGQQLARQEGYTAAVTSSIVLSTFLLCWTPYFCFIVIQVSGSDLVNKYYGSASVLLALLSSTCTPIVYVFRSRKNRNVVLQVCQRETVVQELAGNTSSEVRRDSEASDVTSSSFTHVTPMTSEMSTFTIPGSSSIC